MSGPDAPTAAWQRADIAEEFLATRKSVLPLIDVQEELVRLLFERRARPVARFLDIGSGDGAMSELMRAVAPDAEAVLVDFSEPMLARVRDRGSGRAWHAVRADLSVPSWHQQLPAGPYDAAVSSFAIHHLTAERKRALFSELYALLAPGAMFVNMDVVSIRGPLAGLFDERIAAAHAELEGAPSGNGADHAHEPFEDAAEDRPDPAAEQLEWLREAGFEDVELHFKWAEGAIFGAVKPS